MYAADPSFDERYGGLFDAADEFDEEPAHLDEEEYEEAREEREFARVLPNERDAMLDRHEEACNERLQDLEGKLRRLEDSAKTGVWVNHARVARLRSHCQALRAQRNTWRLLKLLVENELVSDGLPPPDSMVEDEEGPPGAYSELAVQVELDRRDSEYRLFETARRWLEDCAVEGVSFVEEDAQPLRTLQRLQRSESLETCVSELDPDAARRQRKPLDPDDVDAQGRFFHAVFQLLRAGLIEEAKGLCEGPAGQPWLAALLHGLVLSRAGRPDEEGEAAEGEAGNPRPVLFGELCGRLAGPAGSAGLHERAVYGFLGAALDALLPACASWEDHLWARLAVAARAALRARLAARPDPYRDGDEPPQPQGRPAVDELLEAARPARREEGPAGVYREAQEALLTGRTADLVRSLAGAVAEPSPSDGPEARWLRRFATHLAVALLAVGARVEVEDARRVTRAYVAQLTGALQSGLVARYVGLPVVGHRERVALYARYLHSLIILPDDADAGDASRTRQRAIDAARKAVAAFPDEAIEILDEAACRTIALPSPGPTAGGGVNGTDGRKVRAVEVVLLAGGAGPEAPRSLAARALVHSNALARRFVEEEKLEAVDALVQAVRIVPHEEELEAMEAAFREHLCWRDYVAAHRAYEAWRAWQGRRPAPPAAVPVTTSEVVRLEYEEAHRAHGAALARHHEQGEELVVAASEAIGAVLLFKGGWLRRPAPAAPLPSDAEEEAALRRLRAACVPRAVGWMRAVLHETGRLEDCVRLAEIVADDEYGLHESFSEAALQAFLLQLAPALAQQAPVLCDL